MGRKRGPVEQAVWRGLDPKLRRGALAMAAFEVARQLDDGVEVVDVWGERRAVRTSAKDTAALTRELRAALAELRALAPPKAERDGVDDLAARRSARRATAGRAAP
ncbi:MAG TPA: hypothetical protein VJ653_04500 [Acidimicrobiales bacterium]|nr:hypothetical protein [Acidimicrobiales bacterium]